MPPADFSSLALFASSQPTPLTSEFQTGLISSLSIAALALSVWAYFRRRPPVDADLSRIEADLKALKEQHAALVEKQDREAAEQRKQTDDLINGVYKRIEAVQSSFNRNFQTMERALGRIEGAIERNQRT
ncbi:hypothetical protein [Geminisphaera colitermitum]|uniref:hypothetical protein n=1 Tax=Geminisphaera colitermitum TaxID=1148786 RepID=UPI000158CA8E|nr:hypothetical protein [Geminisphaera colitermitum]